MTAYNWKFVASGRIHKKVKIFLCIENIIHKEYTDANVALREEDNILKNGDTITGHTVEDFFADKKREAESSWSKETFVPKVVILDTKSFSQFLKGR